MLASCYRSVTGVAVLTSGYTNIGKDKMPESIKNVGSTVRGGKKGNPCLFLCLILIL